jgi:hypothetical protein
MNAVIDKRCEIFVEKPANRTIVDRSHRATRLGLKTDFAARIVIAKRMATIRRCRLAVTAPMGVMPMSLMQVRAMGMRVQTEDGKSVQRRTQVQKQNQVRQQAYLKNAWKTHYEAEN